MTISSRSSPRASMASVTYWPSANPIRAHHDASSMNSTRFIPSIKSCRSTRRQVKNSDSFSLSGGCLCGGVRYRIDGDCRDIICCHCENCRRTHGHFAAYTAVQQSALTLLSKDTLQWYHDEPPD